MNLQRCCVIVLLGLSGLAAAWAQETAAPYDQKQDMVYGEVHGVGLLMDVFVPKGAANGLGIVDVASGAWHSDRGKIRDHEKAQMYAIYCGKGYTVFAIRPGSRSKYTALEMLANVKTGIRYVKTHAADYGIDPNRLGLTGASAGGHLATLAAVTADPPNPAAKDAGDKLGTQVKAVAVFFPPTDFLNWNGSPPNLDQLGDLLFAGGVAGHPKEEVEAQAKKISPALLIQGGLPPFLLIHGDADPLVPLQQSQEFIDALKKAGDSGELIIKPGGAHPWPTIAEEVKVMSDWFDKHLVP